MQHYDTERWCDHVRGLTTGAERRAMNEHLLSGCADCARIVATFRRVMAAAGDGSQEEPPEPLLRSVNAYFELQQPPRRRRLLAVPFEVGFDNLLESTPSGTRSLGDQVRRLVLYTRQLAIDLRVEKLRRAPGLLLEGEVLDRQGEPVRDLPAILLCHGTIVARTVSGRLGQFRLQSEIEKALELCLLLGENRMLDVWLDRPGLRPLPSTGTD